MKPSHKKTAFIGARLLDPSTGLDQIGDLLINANTIEAIGPELLKKLTTDGIDIVDCSGLCLSPGLIDMRVQLREPGEEHKESIKSITEAAVSGGVTSMACLPNTQPVIDDQATFEYVNRRARKQGSAKIYAYGAATKGLKGAELAELGMLAEAGAVGFTDGIYI
jgi:dihydroorotase